MLPAAVNSLGTLVGMWQIDKSGRRQVIAHNHVITRTLQACSSLLSNVFVLMSTWGRKLLTVDLTDTAREGHCCVAARLCGMYGIDCHDMCPVNEWTL